MPRPSMQLQGTNIWAAALSEARQKRKLGVSSVPTHLLAGCGRYGATKRCAGQCDWLSSAGAARCSDHTDKQMSPPTRRRRQKSSTLQFEDYLIILLPARALSSCSSQLHGARTRDIQHPCALAHACCIRHLVLSSALGCTYNHGNGGPTPKIPGFM